MTIEAGQISTVDRMAAWSRAEQVAFLDEAMKLLCALATKLSFREGTLGMVDELTARDVVLLLHNRWAGEVKEIINEAPPDLTGVVTDYVTAVLVDRHREDLTREVGSFIKLSRANFTGSWGNA
jgi:hypothetical protein